MHRSSTPILIPTRGRAGASKLLSWLNDEERIQTFLFVEPEDIENYKRHYPKLPLVNIRASNQGLSFVRNFTYSWATQQGYRFYWMFDDDVKNFFHRSGTKMIKIEWEHCVDMLCQCENDFVEAGFFHAGMEYQQFAWSAGNKIFNRDSFCDNVVWFDMMRCLSILPTPPYRRELKVKVDRDFCMQVIAKGGTTGRHTIFTFATPPDGSNAGGLKEIVYDKEGWEAEAVDQLISIWGEDKVSKIVKESGRVDAKIHWNKLKPIKTPDLYDGLF